MVDLQRVPVSCAALNTQVYPQPLPHLEVCRVVPLSILV